MFSPQIRYPAPFPLRISTVERVGCFLIFVYVPCVSPAIFCL
jgi:hypothetical protein